MEKYILFVCALCWDGFNIPYSSWTSMPPFPRIYSYHFWNLHLDLGLRDKIPWLPPKVWVFQDLVHPRWAEVQKISLGWCSKKEFSLLTCSQWGDSLLRVAELDRSLHKKMNFRRTAQYFNHLFVLQTYSSSCSVHICMLAFQNSTLPLLFLLLYMFIYLLVAC